VDRSQFICKLVDARLRLKFRRNLWIARSHSDIFIRKSLVSRDAKR